MGFSIKGLASEAGSKAFSVFAKGLGAEAGRQVRGLENAPLPVWTQELLDQQKHDQNFNPLGAISAFKQNLNPPRSTADTSGGSIVPSGSMGFGPGGLFGNVELSAFEIGLVSLIGVGGIILTLRIARLI